MYHISRYKSPKIQRLCSFCRQEGHNIRTCLEYKTYKKTPEKDKTLFGYSELGDFRDKNLPLKDEVWAYRDNRDIYTNRKKRRYIPDDVQTDHVIECQILRHAFNDMPTALMTRSGHRNVKESMNHLLNLNNTTLDINQKKKGPITRYLAI